MTGGDRDELLSYQGTKGMVVRGSPLAPPIHAGHFPFHRTREGESGDSHRGRRANEEVKVRSQKWGEQSAGKEGILVEEENECDLRRRQGPGGPGETSSGPLGEEPSAKTKSQPLRPGVERSLSRERPVLPCSTTQMRSGRPNRKGQGGRKGNKEGRPWGPLSLLCTEIRGVPAWVPTQAGLPE